MLRAAPRLALLLLGAAGEHVPARASATSVGEGLSPVIDDYHPDSAFLIRDLRT